MDVLTIKSPSKTYPVYIGTGLRHQLTQLITQTGKNFSSYFILSDDHVAPLYLNDLCSDLNGPVYTRIIKAGEQAKSFEHYYDMIRDMIAKQLDRKTCVIALGGGVVGDLAGFAAATYLRGVAFIQVPTTLLAHDSSVGGKVGINLPEGKNLIGAFYHPECVVYDVETLGSLPDREWRSGFAEVIKESLIYDDDFFKELRRTVKRRDDFFETNPGFIIKKAMAVKANIVNLDEKELGIRSHLNFGHTLGHAIENELGYGKVTHGEGVAIGMIFAMYLSEAFYEIKLPIADIETWFRELELPIAVPKELTFDRLIQRMKYDKKSENGEIKFVLMKRIGDVETVAVNQSLIHATLQKMMAR